MVSLSRRERILVGLALAGAVCAGGYIYVVEPLRERAQQTAELTPAREAKLKSRQRLVAERAALSAELEEATRRLAQQSARLLQGPTPPLAASELQNLIKEMATESGVETRSERILPPADRNGIQEIPIEISVAGGIRESVALLAAVERSRKMLTLQDVKVRVVATGQPKDILTTLTVSGYLLPASTAPRSGEGPDAAPAKPGQTKG